MSGKEVAGLQALAQKHGLSMTTNPRTGLPEAFSLDSLLPMIAGVGLDVVTGGAFTPMEIAMGVGGADALATGSIQKGLMAGLGAYGGADVGNALSAAGAGTTVADTSNAAVPDYISAAPAAVQTAANPSISSIIGNSPVMQALNPSDLSASTGSLGQIASAPDLSMDLPADTGSLGQVAPANSVNSVSNMSNGIANLTNSAGRSSFMDALGASGPFDTAKYNQMLAAGSLAAYPLFYGSSSAPSSAETNLQNTVRPWSLKETPGIGMGTSGGTALNYQWTAGQPYNAVTGQATMAGGGLAKGYPHGDTLHGTLGQLRGVEHLTKMASGGISNLGSYSDGGQLLRGPGDGVSDSIPAQIGQNQPARLAEGEFVIPARIVSELGNGSTNAGAKQLYKMIDRIQAGRQRTMGGKHSYANDTDAYKHLPA
jgi:hypothetical protein